MYAYEIQYKELGVLKHKGFKHKEEYDKFVIRASKSPEIQILRIRVNVSEEE